MNKTSGKDKSWRKEYFDFLNRIIAIPIEGQQAVSEYANNYYQIVNKILNRKVAE